MLCSKCKKRPAVIFLSTPQDKEPRGLCLICAKEEGIKSPMHGLMEKMGIDDEQLELMQQQIDSLVNDDGSIDISELSDGMMPVDLDEIMPGGAQPFPFVNAIFSQKKDDNTQDSPSNDSKNESKKDRKTKNSKKYKHLSAYCDNLTFKAKNNQIDNVIGRDRELNRVIQILCRRTKNNPCLIGEPGVGKTAIAEALALRIAAGKVPQKLKNKEIYLLDLTSLVAGTQFRGQFESRMKGLISEVKEDGNIILFVDEVHNLVGAGDSTEGSMNAANILKPALSRGEIQVIGATTFKEYRKYIEKDSALERRFQPVTVVEPSVEDTVDVLMGIKKYYEDFHSVKVPDSLVRKTVVFSERYITERFLPDKAIDLLDEACSYASLRNPVIAEYNQKQENFNKLKKEEENLSTKENIDFEKLAEVKVSLAKSEQELSNLSKELENAVVTEEDIAHVIEIWTDIPASKIKQGDVKRLVGLDKRIKQKIIGQDSAVDAVCAAIKRSRLQLSPRRHPASFIFVGPTGIGKTELVKVLSKELFDSPETLIRLDMSEYMEKHSVSRIIGSPPGYVGYDEAGQITEKVRRRPYSILLFDEIEKAHPDVMNILLQILDEGKINDSHGRTVNFENTIIVMTSNAGSDKKGNSLGFAKSEQDMTREKVLKALSEFLRPEFLSRIDEIVVFNSLDENNYKDIAKLMLSEYIESIDEKGIKFEFDDKVCEYLAQKSIGGKSGARDIRTLIRREVEDEIANILIEGLDLNIKNLLLTFENDKIKIYAS
ncbi:MAG: ATP-dependent Clp protease ATP-binding subunit [Clostridia bacterium]|nr:ATP-dependent Clp protease ATP-binding subunit [Clostridia bacterium]